MRSREFELVPIPERARAVLALIGNTPLVPLRFEPEGITIYVKCEFLNPSGSIKDRLATRALRWPWWERRWAIASPS
jgi:threonine synthase